MEKDAQNSGKMSEQRPGRREFKEIPIRRVFVHDSIKYALEKVKEESRIDEMLEQCRMSKSTYYKYMGKGDMLASSRQIMKIADFLETEWKIEEEKDGRSWIKFPYYDMAETFDALRIRYPNMGKYSNEELQKKDPHDIIAELVAPEVQKVLHKQNSAREVMAEKGLMYAKALEGGTIPVITEHLIYDGNDAIGNSLMRAIPDKVVQNKDNGKIEDWFGLLLELRPPVIKGGGENPYKKVDLRTGDLLVCSNKDFVYDATKGETDISAADRLVVVTDDFNHHFGKVRPATAEDTLSKNESVAKKMNFTDFVILDRNEEKTGLSPLPLLINSEIVSRERDKNVEWETASQYEDDVKPDYLEPSHIAFHMFKVLVKMDDPFGKSIIPF